MKIGVIHNSHAQAKAYAEFLDKRGGLFMSSDWAKLYSGSQLVRCGIFNKNNEVVGCFQYYTFRKLIFNCVITPPFAPHISLYFDNPAESVVGRNSFVKEVMELVADYFHSLKADLLDISLPAETVDTQPFTWQGFDARWRYSYWLDLRESEEDLWSKLSGEKRKSMNKASKDNLHVELCEDRKRVTRLVKGTLQRNGALSNTTLMEDIIGEKTGRGHSFAFVASDGHADLGAAFCVVDGNTAVYLFGGTAEGNRHHGAGVSCMWQSILHAKRTGLERFDFEGSMQPGIERYFREFGGQLVPYAAIQKRSRLLGSLMKLRGK